MTPEEKRLASIHRRAKKALNGIDEAAKERARIDLKKSREGLRNFWSKLNKWSKENPND